MGFSSWPWARHLKSARRNLTSAQCDAAMRVWLAQPFGLHVLDLQRADAREVFAETAGYRFMELVISSASSLSESAPQMHRFAISPTPQDNVSAVSEYFSLPLPSSVVDVVVLRHILDYCEYPHESLKEAARVVMPSGQLIVFGFNPFGGLGLLRWVMRPLSGNIVWQSRCLSAGRVVDWLRLRGFQCEKVVYRGYNLPLQSRRYLARTAWLEKVASRLRMPFGTYYVIVARKQRLRPITHHKDWLAKAMTPVKLASKPAVEPTKNEH